MLDAKADDDSQQNEFPSYDASHSRLWMTTMLSFRLLLASVALPVLVAAIDHRALDYAAAHRWRHLVVAALFSWFVIQVGLLSFTAGRLSPNWGWRLLIVGWSLLLINLTLGRIALLNWNAPRLLALALYSSEVGALASWIMLGAAHVWRRLAIVAMAALPLLYLQECLHLTHWASGLLRGPYWGGGYWDDPWTVIVMVQVGGVTAALALLRAAGYRIEPSHGADAEAPGGPVQFSLRHLLIATTVVAVVIPIMQHLLRSSQWLTGVQWLHAASDGLLLALVSFAALWAALGQARSLIKALLFLALALAAGAALWWLETSIGYKGRWSFRPEPLTDAGRWWFAWTLLTGSFLAGSLLVLRATGHRLVRRARTAYGG
ncbi:MAG TPA: hypothetical protein VFW87_06625 [Pirellulales bacterium]|nr:hypothetical protein [Pirellulales bacterium]